MTNPAASSALLLTNLSTMGNQDHTPNIAKIESQLEVLSESINTALDTKFSKIQHSYSDVVKGLETTTQSLDSKISDLDKKYDASLRNIETNSNTMIKVAEKSQKREEQASQDFRDKNVIIFGLKEDSDSETTVGQVNKILEKCNIPPIIDNSKCYRLGPKPTDSKGRGRPIRLCTDSKSIKFDLLKRLNALKISGVFARKDLNQLEREEDFRLRTELKRVREESKDKTFMIRKGQIVELEGTNSK
jgi:hypothetical protein